MPTAVAISGAATTAAGGITLVRGAAPTSSPPKGAELAPIRKIQ